MTKNRRAAGDGSIQYRPERAKPWEARTSRANGRKGESRYFATQGEAAAWLRSVNSEIDQKTRADPHKLTVSQWLDLWLETYIKPATAPRTYDGYKSVISLYIVPAFGNVPLQSLLPADVQLMANNMNKSKRTIQYAITTLRSALKQAIADGLISRNVAERIRIPAQASEPVKRTALTADQLQQLYDGSEGRLHIAIRIMAMTGVRIGELLALRWSDVTSSHIRINNAVVSSTSAGLHVSRPKTASSIRNIPIVPALAQTLSEWRISQLEERFYAGIHWEGTDDFILTMPIGTRMRQEWLSKHLHRIARENGFDCTPHILRHTFASRLVLAKVDLKTIQEMLGHSSERMVMQVYAHSNDEAKLAALIAIS